jgi:anhydro-N-acetylmuramic acid kinase
MNKRDYVVLGLMSGTSCDGLDLMLCRIFFDHQWKYEILAFETSSYHSDEVDALKNIAQLTAADLMRAHAHWGDVFGQKAKNFLGQFPNVSVDFIASHGHTVFHQPHAGFTFQMGLGANIAVATQLPVLGLRMWHGEAKVRLWFRLGMRSFLVNTISVSIWADLSIFHTP